MAFKRAIVTAVGPLRILIDGDTVAIPFTPKSLIDPATLTVGDVVSAELSGNRLVVLGRSGGTFPTWGSIDGKPLGYPAITRDYATYTPAASHSIYPIGLSNTLVEPAVGWPVSNQYGNIMTNRAYSGEGTIQYWSSYRNDGGNVYYRQWFYRATAWSAWQKLAVAGKDGVPFAQAAGEVTTGYWATVTWPSGRFSVTPKIVAQMYTSSGSAIGEAAMVTNASNTSCIMRNSSGTHDIHWHAIQMTSGSASG